jgi:tetratricopeptide (TPR) repeat protein
VLELAVTHALRENRPAWLRAFLQRDSFLPEALKIGLAADMLFAEGDYAKAAAVYSRAHAALPFLVWEQRRAEALCRAGQRDEAIALLRGLHARRPWQINTLLRLTDLLMDRDRNLAFPPGRGVVRLYTWNKSQDIDATLASLAASELSDPAGGGRGARHRPRQRLDKRRARSAAQVGRSLCRTHVHRDPAGEHRRSGGAQLAAGPAGSLAGRLGHLRVLHKRSSGYRTSFNRRGWASSMGNWYKLQASYSEEEATRIFELDQKTMWDDLLQRLEILRAHDAGA